VPANTKFFRTFWQVLGPAVTAHRAGSDAEIFPLLDRLRVSAGARVLDVPCGFGRHSVELARCGYRVTGMDISGRLLAQARRQAAEQKLEVEFRRGDMRRLNYRNRFDLVLNLFTSFGYFGDAEDARVLKRFYRALRPRGWLALHVVNRDFVVRLYRPRQRSKLKNGFVLEENGHLDLGSSILRTEWIARRGGRRWRGVTRLRLYSCHELVRMLAAAGFGKVQAFGGFAGEPLTMDSWWQLLLAKRAK
jgi:SAM-dependent methyltransferase